MIVAISVLRKEHDAILRMLDVTAEVSKLLKRREPIDPETLSSLLEFFRMFADQCHHGKEEAMFLPMLDRKGMPPFAGPVGVMLQEHEKGRDLVREMADATDSFLENGTGSGRRWAKAAGGYIWFLRQHIFEENNILFVIAEERLNPSEQARLEEEFERQEMEKMGPGTQERIHALMDKLSSQFLGKEK